MQNLTFHIFGETASLYKNSRILQFILCFLLLVSSYNCWAQTAKDTSIANNNRLTVEHLLQLADVSDPQISPEGDWIAYTVSLDNAEADEARSRIWMVPAKGGDAVPLTAEDQSSSHARWSPDGQYLRIRSIKHLSREI